MAGRRVGPAVDGVVTAADALLARIKACRHCVTAPAGPPLPHEPRPIAVLSESARIAICSQAPGIRAHQAGVPFLDPSGRRLREWMGVDEATFYDASRIAIAPMGMCFPGYDAQGGDLPPRRECAPLWRAQVMASMPRLELLLTIGLYAQRWHLGPRWRGSLTATVEGWRDLVEAPVGPVVLALPHPSWRNNAWIKRHPFFTDDVLPELRRRVAALL